MKIASLAATAGVHQGGTCRVFPHLDDQIPAWRGSSLEAARRGGRGGGGDGHRKVEHRLGRRVFGGDFGENFIKILLQFLVSLIESLNHKFTASCNCLP